MAHPILHFFGIAAQEEVAAVKAAIDAQALQINDLTVAGYALLASIVLLAGVILLPELWSLIKRIKNYRG